MSTFHRNQHIDDPEAVPVRDAATVLVIRDGPELEVLMVQRAGRLAFGANAWVYPGGRVDRADAVNAARVGINLSDADASAMLDVDSGGLAWWFAAVRETVEEVGMLLGTPEVDVSLVAELRATLDEHGGDGFCSLLEEHQIALDLSALHEVARFVTPVGPPRRFDTRFFVARAPVKQVPQHDASEIVATQWIKPADAMSAWRAGELELMAVTHRMLACLDRFDTAEEVLARAALRPAAAHLRVDDPDGEYLVYMPGDPEYETADIEVEHGSIRLY
jgi:8-oxo-dGTP pyrophosphatase MutT (NUDIX family)